MAKKMSLSLCLLSTAIFAGVPAQAAMTTSSTASAVPLIAQYGIAEIIPQMAAEQPLSEKVTLTVEDLPPGFTELPPELAASIASRLDVIRQQLGQENLKPENFFAFVNQQNFQFIIGFTGKLPNQTQQANFDSSLQRLQQPENQQQMMSLLEEKLKDVGGIKVTDYRAIPELNNLANASTGLTLAMEMRGQPLRLDFAAFRRNTVGAFTAVMYANGEQPAIALGDVARKLDSRIVDFSANANHSSVAKAQ